MRSLGVEVKPVGVNGYVECVECGGRGFPGCTWLLPHQHHVTCTCGKRVTAKGHTVHRSAKRQHGHPCP